MASEPLAQNSWAPELFYDRENGRWLIFWATTIPGRFPETEGMGDGNCNHRLYYTTTRDFEAFSPSALFYNPGFNSIDATITRADGQYVMFLKDETLKPPSKNIRMAVSREAGGSWGPASPPITGNYWAEGPTSIRIGGTWLVYFDKYMEGKYGVVASEDLKTWKDRSDELHFPDGVRHGTVFRAPKKAVMELLRTLPHE